MILLTKLNGAPVLLNEAMVEYVEAKPDSTIVMATGNVLLVRQSVEEIARLANRQPAVLSNPAVHRKVQNRRMRSRATERKNTKG